MTIADVIKLLGEVAAILTALGALRHSQNTRRGIQPRPPRRQRPAADADRYPPDRTDEPMGRDRGPDWR